MNHAVKKHITTIQDSLSKKGTLNFNMPQRGKLRIVSPDEQQAIDEAKIQEAINESEALVRQMSTDQEFEDMVQEDSFSLSEASAIRRIEKKSGAIHPALSYFRSKNHLEVHKTGTQYQIDYELGMKSFAFNSIGESAVAQTTILGLASYFSYHQSIAPVIVTNSYKDSYFYKAMPDLEIRHKSIEGITYKVYVGAGVEILEYAQLRSVLENSRVDVFENFLNSLIYNSEMVLWDFPHQKIMDGQREVFFPLMKRLSNISIIMERSRTKANDLKNLIEYYSRYNVDVKGVMLAAQ